MIIGLHGFAGAGKDTAALALIEDGWHRIAFGDMIRSAALGINPLIPTPGGEVLHLDRIVHDLGWDAAKQNPFVRELLQNVGDTARARFGERVWLDATFDAIPADAARVVVTDVRMPVEGDAVVAAGGFVIDISRPGVGPVNSHRTENSMGGYPFTATIVNDGDVAQLHDRLRRLVAHLKSNGGMREMRRSQH